MKIWRYLLLLGFFLQALGFGLSNINHFPYAYKGIIGKHAKAIFALDIINKQGFIHSSQPNFKQLSKIILKKDTLTTCDVKVIAFSDVQISSELMDKTIDAFTECGDTVQLEYTELYNYLESKASNRKFSLETLIFCIGLILEVLWFYKERLNLLISKKQENKSLQNG